MYVCIARYVDIMASYKHMYRSQKVHCDTEVW